MPNITHVTPDMNAPRPAWVMPPDRDVTVRGYRIRYWDKGAGKPIVFMHGFSGSASFEWGRVIDALALRHRVIALQCIGFAPSEVPDIVYSTEALTDHLGAFFTALDLNDITLVGESFGGWLVGSYAVRSAGADAPLPKLRKLVIVGGAVGDLRGGDRNANGFVQTAVMREVEAHFRNDPIPDNEATKAKIFEASGLAKHELTAEKLSRIDVPTLLLWGDRDALIPLAVGQRALAAIPNSSLTVFKDIGHIPSVECPNEFIAAVDAFAA
jgi:pimeloyl-ACP methyl ester carboxylesterase